MCLATLYVLEFTPFAAVYVSAPCVYIQQDSGVCVFWSLSARLELAMDPDLSSELRRSPSRLVLPAASPRSVQIPTNRVRVCACECVPSVSDTSDSFNWSGISHSVKNCVLPRRIFVSIVPMQKKVLFRRQIE